ncbi:hypothetical protein LXL04_014067 [Taraxacum kok-saghyz]
MVFGRKQNRDSETLPTYSDSETDGTHISETQDQTTMDVDAEVQQQTAPTSSVEIDPSKPLYAEVTYTDTLQVQETTRVVEVLNTGPITTVNANMSALILESMSTFLELLVKEAKKNGVATKSLKNSVLLKNTCSTRKIEDAFKMLERDEVDMKIIRGLCANGIPSNVLRNPQFLEMIQAIQKAPDGYKPPSYEKARTSLIDQCVREMGKELDPVKDTWLAQGVSIVSDGWSDKTGVVIAKFLQQAIEEIGPSSVIQVVTDNAANCKAAGREIEKDMAKKFEWLSETYNRGKGIVKFFLNHTHALAFFTDNSKLQLVKVDEHTRLIANKVTDRIKNGDCWDDIAHILAVTKPIFYMVKSCDGGGPKMVEIYEQMDSMMGQITKVMTLRDNKFSIYYPEVEVIVVQRWDKMTIPLHCLGFALNPKYYDKHYLEKLSPEGMKRNPPNQDKEVIVGVLKAFARILESEEEKLLREQFASFHMKKGIYALAGTQADAVTMDTIDWWATYGAETPDLADVAKRVL